MTTVTISRQNSKLGALHPVQPSESYWDRRLQYHLWESNNNPHRRDRPVVLNLIITMPPRILPHLSNCEFEHRISMRDDR